MLILTKTEFQMKRPTAVYLYCLSNPWTFYPSLSAKRVPLNNVAEFFLDQRKHHLDKTRHAFSTRSPKRRMEVQRVTGLKSWKICIGPPQTLLLTFQSSSFTIFGKSLEQPQQLFTEGLLKNRVFFFSLLGPLHGLGPLYSLPRLMNLGPRGQPLLCHPQW